MKDSVKLPGIILVLVAGILISCPTDDGGGDVNHYVIVEETQGRLTIINIPAEYNNQYAYAILGLKIEEYNVLAAASVRTTDGYWIGGKITKGTVTLKLWDRYFSNYDKSEVKLVEKIGIFIKDDIWSNEYDSYIFEDINMPITFLEGVGYYAMP
jgi:hypothetical protein